MSPGSTSNSSLIAAVAAATLVVVLLVLVAILVYWRYRCRLPRRNSKTQHGGLGLPLPSSTTIKSGLAMFGISGLELNGPREFSYEELKVATSDFSEESVLGEGGFGKVHRGLLPADKSLVAVKRVGQHSSQGEREFVAEVTTIGRLRHKNLVPLRGWCKNGDELLLAYEYMPNGSLYDHLFASSSSRSCTDDDDESKLKADAVMMLTPLAPTAQQQAGVLAWNHRYRALQGVSSALHYLHAEWEEQTIIHRDVKSSNVMLDANWNARLGDFGLARLVDRNKSAATVTSAAGTRGYMAPESLYTDKVSAESDVFSYGVMALEVASGRRPVEWLRPSEQKFLVNWIWTLKQEGRLLDAADPQLAGEYDTGQMKNVMSLGLLCCAEEPTRRPCMRQVSQYLITGHIDLPTSREWMHMPPLSNTSGAVSSASGTCDTTRSKRSCAAKSTSSSTSRGMSLPTRHCSQATSASSFGSRHDTSSTSFQLPEVTTVITSQL